MHMHVYGMSRNSPVRSIVRSVGRSIDRSEIVTYRRSETSVKPKHQNNLIDLFFPPLVIESILYLLPRPEGADTTYCPVGHTLVSLPQPVFVLQQYIIFLLQCCNSLCVTMTIVMVAMVTVKTRVV